MKNKYILMMFLLGMLLTVIGALFKITHWEIGFITGTSILSIGLLLEALTAVTLIVKLAFNKNDSFLNK